MLKNGTPASPATARARRVLPVPGGPNSSTPLGMRAPRLWNRFGFSRKSLISSSSSTASSTPATSLKVILGWSTAMRLARDLPKLITLLPPPCIWFIRKMKKTTIRRMGRMVVRTEPQMELFWTSVVNGTLWSSRYCSMLYESVNPIENFLLPVVVSVPSTTRSFVLTTSGGTVWTCFASTAF